MPRLSLDGRAAMGIGSTPGSVDRVVILNPGDGLCWLDTELCVAQTIIDGLWCIAAVHRLGGTPEQLDGPGSVVAGGGRWFGWTDQRGIFGIVPWPPLDDPTKWTRARPRAAGHDGTLAYVPDYASGLGLVLLARDGTETRISDGYSVDVQVIGPTAAIWTDGATFHAAGVPRPRPSLAPGRIRRVVLPDGEVWLVYGCADFGLVAQMDGALDGYILEPQQIAFNHDAVAVGADLVVAWSVTTGEGPDDLRRLVVDRTAPRVALIPPTPEPEPPDPEPEPPEPPKPEPEPEPEPPKPQPERPYRQHKEHRMAADQIGVVRGPGGKLGRPGDKNTGPWGSIGAGWRGLVFDGGNEVKGNGDVRYRFLRPADRQTALVSQQTGAVAGCDATLHSGGLNQQFYVKPDGDRSQGFAEEWQFYDGNANGAIQAQVEYAPGRGGDDGPFFSYPLAFEVIE